MMTGETNPSLACVGPNGRRLLWIISSLVSNADLYSPFKLRYDVEDTRGGDRTKYYLLHVSNHVKAVLLMKEVMWPLGDEEGTFDYSGESNGILISSTPTV